MKSSARPGGTVSQNKLSLFWLVLLSGGAFMLFLALSCALALKIYAKPKLESQWLSAADTLSRQFAASVAKTMAEVSTDARDYAQRSESPKSPGARESMRKWLDQHPLATAIYWLDEHGRVSLAATKEESLARDFEGMSMASNPEFQLAAKGVEGWSSAFLSPATRSSSVGRFTKASSGFLVVELDQEKLSELFRQEGDSLAIWQLALVDAKSQVVANSKSGSAKQLSNMGAEGMRPGMDMELRPGALVLDGAQVLASFSAIDGAKGWRALAFVESSAVYSSLEAASAAIWTAIAIAGMIASLGLLMLANRLSRSMLALVERAKELSLGITEARNVDSSVKEIAQVTDSIDLLFGEVKQRELDLLHHQSNLEDAVEERSRGLIEANQELAKAFESLKVVQASLIESEKMASLGNMVAGVAHELNTPIGNAYLSSTTLIERIDGLGQRLESGKLSKRDFLQDIEKAAKLAKMVKDNLELSADLVKSFKRVAVDQTSQKIHAFDLVMLATDAMASFQAASSRKGIEWSIEGEAEAFMVSNPGAWIQILSNFYNNAMLHAFDGREKGRLTVKIECRSDRVWLYFEDDGMGMSDEVRRKAFDPFFTTKPGVGGGSGIGLHLCYQLVEKALQGTLRVVSEPGKGARFEVCAPREIELPKLTSLA